MFLFSSTLKFHLTDMLYWNEKKINIGSKFWNVFFQHLNKWNENVQDNTWKTALKSAEETEKKFRHGENSR